ncbi:MAG: hypothetical protein ACKV22_14185 [Bryobacteraceae bacterium]
MEKMRFSTPVAFCLLLAMTAGSVLADVAIYIFDPLPTPLKLPPGLIQTLPLNHEGSYFGDQLRAVDCSPAVPAAFPGNTWEDEVRFGTCGNQLFGGMAMTDSHLTGSLTIQFFPTSSTSARFVVTQNLLTGDDGTLTAPLGYNMPVKGNRVSDTLTLSSGDVDLITGAVDPNTLKWYCFFGNTALFALGNVNPKLGVPVIAFPGIRGSVWANFSQRPDGRLDFFFRGSTFLGLNNDTLGDPVRFPLPFCGPTGNCASVLARGTSLHPHLQLDTRDSLGYAPCAPNCPDIPVNTTQIFTVNARYSAYGDDFDLDIPQLGGLGPGRAELQGRVQVQFGPRIGNGVPIQLSVLPPEGLFAEPPNNPLTGPGFRGFLLGTNQQLRFPSGVIYDQHKLYFVDEPYNRTSGMVDLASGKIVGELVYPMYIDQSIIETLIPANNGRVSADPFLLVAQRPPQNPEDPTYAYFEKGVNGQTTLRMNLFHKRSFATYCYPTPVLQPNLCWISGDKGNLNIFGKIQAAHLADPANPGNAVLSDTRTFTSSIGDRFSYSFIAPCDAVGKAVSFTYTNNNTGPSGGTFTMTHPASVSCTNSAVSKAGVGGYDQVAITGFGKWSKDASDDLPRFMASSISVDPANPFAAIIVFARYPGEPATLPGAKVLPGDDIDVNLSTAENKPPNKPIP